MPLWASLPGAIIVCVVIALVIGAPVLKLSDVYLAIIDTLGFGEVVRIVIIFNPDWTGGPTGANLSTGIRVRGHEANADVDALGRSGVGGVILLPYAKVQDG